MDTLNNAKAYMGDTAVTAAIKAKFLLEDLIKSLSIHVETKDGVVTLTGTVPSQAALDKAKDIAHATDGVSQVITSLEIKN